MFGVRPTRAIIYATLAFLSTLTISGRHLLSARYQQSLAEKMATALKLLTVPSKGSHTATVIFMHVRHHSVISTFSPDTDFLAGTGRLWLRLEVGR